MQTFIRLGRFQFALVELQARHAQQSVRDFLHAGEFGRIRPEPVTMKEIDNRAFLVQYGRNFFIALESIGGIQAGARLVEQRIRLGLAIPGVIQGLLAGSETIDIAVRISTPAPGENVGFKVTLIGKIQ